MGRALGRESRKLALAPLTAVILGKPPASPELSLPIQKMGPLPHDVSMAGSVANISSIQWAFGTCSSTHAEASGAGDAHSHGAGDGSKQGSGSAARVPGFKQGLCPS